MRTVRLCYTIRKLTYLHHSSPVEYAELSIIDFAKLAMPGGDAELAKEVHDAMITSGFLYVINHGHTQEQVRSGVPIQRRSLSFVLTHIH